MANRRTNRREPSSGIRTGDRKGGRTIQGGRQPTMQHPKPTGPVNIGKPITDTKKK
jgi:hypothetical protein